MVQLIGFALLGLYTLALCELNPPYYADLTWQPARTLSNWSNLTVQTRTGTFVGMLNDTYPNVRQFLRVPFAQVRPSVNFSSKPSSKFKSSRLIFTSLQLVISGGFPLIGWPTPRKESIRPDTARVGDPTSEYSIYLP